jgi:4a-hydroxytetrahydrobiopterin dehydratase
MGNVKRARGPNGELLPVTGHILGIEMYKKLEIKDLLLTLSGWSAVEGREAIFKKYVFKDFNQAFAIMKKVAEKADQMDHHPEWFNVYNRLEVTLTTHDASGVTSYDQELANFIDKVASI